jgi:hypothetical protein
MKTGLVHRELLMAIAVTLLAGVFSARAQFTNAD